MIDKRIFLAISLCAGIFLAWQHFYITPMMEKQKNTVTSVSSTSSQQASLAQSTGEKLSSIKSSDKTLKAAVGNEPKTILIGPEGFKVSLNLKGAYVSDIHIQTKGSTNSDQVKTLISSNELGLFTSSSPEWATVLENAVYSVIRVSKLENGKDEAAELFFEDENVQIRKTVRTAFEVYSLDSDLQVLFKKTAPSYVFLSSKANVNIPKDLSENERRTIYFNKVGGLESWDAGKLTELKEDLGQGKWMAIASRYFVNALVDLGGSVKPQFQSRPIGSEAFAASFIYKVSANSITIPHRVYFGPKDTDILKQAGHNLDAVVDFGWFTFFAFPLLTALKWFYGFLGNYGLAIILLTVLVKILLYPLTLKSMKSMKEMQRIQPQLNQIKEKYKDDKEKLNQEMLQLMRANGYNPMSGCLPIFIQMPIFIALYNVLYGAIDLYGMPFFGWIHDLSAKDPYYVTPVLLAVMMFLQQKMTPTTTTDPAQQRMMMFMPVIFGVMMLWLPAGLTLYMLVNSVVSIVQQVMVNRTLGIRPKVA